MENLFLFYIHVNSLYTLQYTTHNIISIIWNVFDNKAFCCATKDNFLLLIFIYLFFLLQICNVKPREWNFKFMLLFFFCFFQDVILTLSPIILSPDNVRKMFHKINTSFEKTFNFFCVDKYFTHSLVVVIVWKHCVVVLSMPEHRKHDLVLHKSSLCVLNWTFPVVKQNRLKPVLLNFQVQKKINSTFTSLPNKKT